MLELLAALAAATSAAISGWQHHAEHGRADAVEHLHRYQQVRAAHAGEQRRAPAVPRSRAAGSAGAPSVVRSSRPTATASRRSLRHDDARGDHELHVLAHPAVTSPAARFSIAAFDRWNSTTHAAKISIRRSRSSSSSVSRSPASSRSSASTTAGSPRGSAGSSRARTARAARARRSARTPRGRRSIRPWPHQARRDRAADRRPARVAAEPVAEVGAADERERDRGHGRHEHAAREAVEHLGGDHRHDRRKPTRAAPRTG